MSKPSPKLSPREQIRQMRARLRAGDVVTHDQIRAGDTVKLTRDIGQHKAGDLVRVDDVPSGLIVLANKNRGQTAHKWIPGLVIMGMTWEYRNRLERLKFRRSLGLGYKTLAGPVGKLPGELGR